MVLSAQPMGLSRNALRTIPRYRKRNSNEWMWAARMRSIPGCWFLWGDGFATMEDEEFCEMWEPANATAIELFISGGWQSPEVLT